jgi:hypothetical protein
MLGRQALWYIAGMDWNEECRRVHREGLEARAKMPYENAGLPFRLRPYDETGEHPDKDLVFQQGVDDARRALLRILVVPVFRKVGTPAVLVQADARIGKMPEIAGHFGWPADLGFEEYEKRYSRILKEQYDGTIANMPPHLWVDAIFTTIKGPKIIPFIISTPYHAGEHGEVVYEEAMETSGVVSPLLPDWWESPVN